MLIFTVDSIATHIVGGEMNYRYLGNNNYEITMFVYRDCINGQAPFDNPAAFGLFDSNGNLILNPHISVGSIQQVPNAINSPCLDPPENICYEVARYQFNVNIPPGTGACTITYQRCCRNYTTMNIANIQSTGATYVAVITDSAIAAINSNPVFNEWPPTFICKGAPFTFDHSATDADGDSLVYSLSNPYEGGDDGANRQPDPPAAPPYIPVSFLPPYSLTNMLGGVPLRINSQTGILEATPNEEGQFVYGISVKEYRNGIYLGETRRDFQVNVITCGGITVASIFSPVIACGSLNAYFSNQSYNAQSYIWDFGDLASAVDTSTEFNPAYSYPDTGKYVATLIAISPFDNDCNDTTTGIVNVYPHFSSEFSISNEHCSNEFSFFDMSSGINGTSNYWYWNFGDGSSSSVQNPVHSYAVPGQYNVALFASVDSGCTDTIVKQVTVLQNPVADFSVTLDTCTFTVSLENTSQFASRYRWDYGDIFNSFVNEGNHSYRAHGDYDIRLIAVSDSNCVDTLIQKVSIPPLPVPLYNYTALPCDSTVEFFSNSLFTESVIWDFGDDSFSYEDSVFHTYELSGWIPVQLTAVSPHDCKVINEQGIYIISQKEAEFKSKLDSCSGLMTFYDITENAAHYLWEFGDGTTSTEQNPIHRFPHDEFYNVKLFINRHTQCPDSAESVVHFENPFGEKVFIPNTFTPNGDGINDYFELSIFRPCEIYKLSIFNRWGQKVFESEDASNVRWDGSFDGGKLAEDIYVYLLESNGETKNGFVSIMR